MYMGHSQYDLYNFNYSVCVCALACVVVGESYGGVFKAVLLRSLVADKFKLFVK